MANSFGASHHEHPGQFNACTHDGPDCGFWPGGEGLARGAGFLTELADDGEPIAAAKADWTQKRFALVPSDEKEFIPLPE
jgi:hypothetical protein